MTTPLEQSRTSALTHWRCQCGVNVPIGCSHTCGPYPLREGSGAAVGHPRLDMQLAEVQAERDRFRELWNGTRDTAERFRAALEQVMRETGTSTLAHHAARDALVEVDGKIPQ